jgi:hypothetical protein
MYKVEHRLNERETELFHSNPENLMELARTLCEPDAASDGSRS